MIRERGKGATVEEVARTLQAFARAVDARRSYASHHAVVVRALSDLTQAFEGLLKETAEIALDVEPEALVFQGERVLESVPPETSIAQVLHRDALRSLSFMRGVTSAELEVLVTATAQGLSYGGGGDDVAWALWREPLPHVRYETWDASMDLKVAGHLDEVIGAIGAIELEPKESENFHPIRKIAFLPAQRDELVQELGTETDHALAVRATRVLVRAWQEAAREEDGVALSQMLLAMFDGALVDDDPALATIIARAVQPLEKGVSWSKDAASEARLRRLVPMLGDQPGRQNEVLEVIDALGRAAMPALFALLAALPDPVARRAASERIVRWGVDDLGPIKELINREPTFLAQEAIFILGRIATPEALAAIRDARVHPKLHVRLALVESLRHVPAEVALSIALDLLGKEEDPKVLAATARSLLRYKTKETSDALDVASHRLPDRPLPYDTKLAILVGYATANGPRAVPLLARYVKRGEGLLVRREAEELAAAAVRAIGSIRGQRTGEIVQKAAQSRSKLVKEAARDVLQQAQGEAPS